MNMNILVFIVKANRRSSIISIDPPDIVYQLIYFYPCVHWGYGGDATAYDNGGSVIFIAVIIVICTCAAAAATARAAVDVFIFADFDFTDATISTTTTYGDGRDSMFIREIGDILPRLCGDGDVGAGEMYLNEVPRF